MSTPNHVSNPAGIILVSLVAKPGLKRRGSVGGIDHDDPQFAPAKPSGNPGGVHADFEPDPVHILSGCPDGRGNRFWRAVD
ncbi:hypothetical protein HN018_23025 (plasmid) [Lichenicola cladoniae]|uniref:Uncharacterized protein n=1 Tax=Lichenicola cladoniae TaxID=1484109 RepID=A0A6M8HXF7_9PROT|nr:hypothetical protein [Lichenicola cladoniae]NPD68692.1 hypothetical protein [Acetobacteraceae bacterium]QKE93072.1 hypothetical protein HN018_23025 [Lichenicola cladoniae]